MTLVALFIYSFCLLQKHKAGPVKCSKIHVYFSKFLGHKQVSLSSKLFGEGTLLLVYRKRFLGMYSSIVAYSLSQLLLVIPDGEFLVLQSNHDFNIDPM